MFRLFVSVLAVAVFAPVAAGASAVRDLPPAYGAGVTSFTVTITITPPPSVAAAGIEDRPPVGWPVSNISDGGSYDAVSKKVKWGPFFGSVPAAVTYDLAVPTGAHGQACFTGKVSFDGLDTAITGDACVGGPVPTVSAWGLASLALGLATAATILLRRHRLAPMAS